MIDTFHLPYNDNNVRVFTVNSSGSTGWQIWTKPQNAKFVHILAIGGGGGGGGGVGASALLRNGGGGGASSSLTTALYMGYMVPDTLYVSVGKGGSGGTSGTNGSSGELSFVSCLPNTAATNCYLVSGAAPAGGGSAGLSTSVAGTVFTTSQAFNSYNALVETFAGQPGGAAVQGGAGNSIVISSLPLTGGASGGGATAANANFSGGSINSFSFMSRILGGLSGTSGSDGSGGFVSTSLNNYSDNKQIFLMTGGAGGGSNALGTGWRGGNGAFGCGGGGGGAGFSASGGRGGDGGSGLVIITAW